MPAESPQLVFHDRQPSVETMREEVLCGLLQPQKTLPCKFFYDQRGSQLFDRICELQEYYPTRTELGIMQKSASKMAELIGPECMLVEYGSGSSVKTRLLLDELKRPAAYVPIDISGEHLESTATDLFARYPDLDVLPVCADFTRGFELPESRRPVRRCVVYFPGSTIGNLEPTAARKLLRGIGEHCGGAGGLLIGVDLKKDRAILELAYNDGEGVTREFNLNLLRRINRELDADFQLPQFRHHAFYNEELGRMEIHLVSRCDQTVTVDDVEIEFEADEPIHTENSYKYDLEQFGQMAAEVGFRLDRVWTDSEKLFSVQYLTHVGRVTE